MRWIASRSLSSGARSRDPVARNDDIRRTGTISDFQKLSLTLDPNQLLISRHPVPREGALAIVTDVGAGSGGRRCAFDERRVKRTAKSCGPDAPMAGVKFARSSRFLGMTVTSKLWSHRGEHEDKPSNHCAGKAGLLPLNLYARVRFLFAAFAHGTAGAARTRSSLRPLFLGEAIYKT